MNAFDDKTISEKSFAMRDLLGIDRWDSFSVSTNLVAVGALTTVGRYRIVGKSCELQATFSASTSIATTTGLHYFNLPIAAKGLAGESSMTNTSTNAVVGGVAINVAESRGYFPSQTPSAATFAVAGRYEIG